MACSNPLNSGHLSKTIFLSIKQDTGTNSQGYFLRLCDNMQNAQHKVQHIIFEMLFILIPNLCVTSPSCARLFGDLVPVPRLIVKLRTNEQNTLNSFTILFKCENNTMVIHSQQQQRGSRHAQGGDRTIKGRAIIEFQVLGQGYTSIWIKTILLKSL